MSIEKLAKRLAEDEIKLELKDGVYYLNGWAFAEEMSPFELEMLKLENLKEVG
jgi:hypothetical protein